MLQLMAWKLLWKINYWFTLPFPLWRQSQPILKCTTGFQLSLTATALHLNVQELALYVWCLVEQSYCASPSPARRWWWCVLWEQKQTRAVLVSMPLPFLMFVFGQKRDGSLSMLQAPITPLCKDCGCFNSKISHACKLGAKSVGWWLWRGCSHKRWPSLNETRSLLAACRLRAAEKGYAEGTWLCFFAFGQLLVWCHCLNTVPPLKFKWILTVWTVDVVWYVAWFYLSFTCCGILEKKIQLSTLTSVMLFGNFCHATLFPCFQVWTSSSTPLSNYFFYSLQSVKCLSSILSSEVFWTTSR